jgi:hypothetical protein
MEKMTSSIAQTAGIEISKDHLDVHRLSDGASRRFKNDKAGCWALVAWIGGDVARVVFEATSADYRAFARGAKGLPLAASPSPCWPSPRSASTSISRPNTNRSSPPETPIVAITAVMRKLIVLANALLNNQRKWTPKSAWSKWIL